MDNDVEGGVLVCGLVQSFVVGEYKQEEEEWCGVEIKQRGGDGIENLGEGL